MICPNCNSQVSENNKFCGICGTKVRNDSVSYMGNVPISTETTKTNHLRNIIIAIVLVAVLIIAISFMIGKKDSFIGSWKFNGFITDNNVIISYDELVEIAHRAEIGEIKEYFSDAKMEIREDGTQTYRTDYYNSSENEWIQIDDKTIILTLPRYGYATLNDGKLNLLFDRSKRISGITIIGVSFK